MLPFVNWLTNIVTICYLTYKHCYHLLLDLQTLLPFVNWLTKIVTICYLTYKHLYILQDEMYQDPCFEDLTHSNYPCKFHIHSMLLLKNKKFNIHRNVLVTNLHESISLNIMCSANVLHLCFFAIITNPNPCSI